MNLIKNATANFWVTFCEEIQVLWSVVLGLVVFFFAVCFKFVFGIYLHVLAPGTNPYFRFWEKHAHVNKFQI